MWFLNYYCNDFMVVFNWLFYVILCWTFYFMAYDFCYVDFNIRWFELLFMQWIYNVDSNIIAYAL